MNYQIQTLTPNYNAALAELIRENLKAHGLDLPGTVYYDQNLYHLSQFYDAEPEKRGYQILVDEKGNLIGGIGIAEFAGIPDCAELQKLYLSDTYKGKGLSYILMDLGEKQARERGYRYLYLETHENLSAALHLYHKCGFREIERPEGVVHSTMNRFFLKELKD